jgi:hypothetical protein
MSYWAEDDPLFANGHYVEEWELERFETFSPEMKAFVRDEARRGNKITSLCKGTVVLQKPPACGVLDLPDGLAFVCPVRFGDVIGYDTDRDGVIVSLCSYERLYPSGLEAPPEPWEVDIVPIHDNEPYAYVVSIHDRRIVLYTAAPSANRFVDVIFDGVAIFQIAEVNIGQNVLMDIVEVSAAQLFHDFNSLFEPKEVGGIVHGYSWAPFQYKTQTEFVEAIERLGLRCFIVDTSMGLYGFVVCKHVTRMWRQERAVVA